MGSSTSQHSPNHRLTRLLGAVTLLAAWPMVGLAATGKTSGCLIEPEQIADVGSPVTGVIEQLPVKLGDVVTAGQALATLRADVERASAQVADMRSNVDAEARAAHANVTLARQKVQRNQQLLLQGFVSDQAVEQAITEAEVAQQRYRLALSQQQIYRQERAVAQAQLGLRTLRSPINGVVVERYSNLGERVEERPVVRVASINPLRVSLMMPMAQYGQIGVGDVMNVKPELPGTAPVKATVSYVDKVVDAASNTFRVRLVLPNPDYRLPGGLRCKADLFAKAPAAPQVSERTVPQSLQPRPTAVGAPPPQVALSPLRLQSSWTLASWRPDTRRRLSAPALMSAEEKPAASVTDGHGPWLTASLTLRTHR